MAVAISLRTRLWVSPADSFEVISESPQGTVRLSDPGHVLARLSRRIEGSDRFFFKVRSEIPPARGLGSSAALLVAAATLFGLSLQEAAAAAAQVEGHPENAAASAYGGLVAAAFGEGGSILTARLSLDPSVVFLVVVPEAQVSTEESRASLPETVALKDAVHNLGSLALLIAALSDHSLAHPSFYRDRIVEPGRLKNLPGSALVLEWLRHQEVVMAALSGSGPTVVAAITREKAPSQLLACEKFLEQNALKAQVLLLEPEIQGVILGEGGEGG